MKRLTLLAAIVAALTLTAAGSAATPWKQGDPRKCSFDRPAYCGDTAARVAFKAKYQRVEGDGFVGSLQCPSTGTLTYMCAWSNPVDGSHQTIVRFAHKTVGWMVSVGAIPVTSP